MIENTHTNNGFLLISAIMRGPWLIEKNWVEANMPLIIQLMKGEGVGLAMQEPKGQSLMAMAGGNNVFQVSPFTRLNDLPKGSIAVVNIKGPVVKYGGICSYGSAEKANLIDRLAANDNVSALLLDMDSPGGQAAGTAMLADAIRNFSAKKPSATFINDGIAASAGMWIGSSANDIFVSQPTDSVGSVGVYTTLVDWYSYYAKEGLPVRDVYATQSTDKNKDYKEAIKNPPNDAPLKESLDQLAQEFINTVARNRGSRLTSSEWQTGKMFNEQKAKKIGLIDGRKSFAQVIDHLRAQMQTKSTNIKSKNMAFENTLAAAQAESFDTVEGGFLMQEDHLNNIENTLVGNASALAEANQAAATREAELQAQLDTANQSLTDRDATIAQMEKDHGEQVTHLQADVAERDNTITACNARIAELENSAPPITESKKTGNDEFEDKPKKEFAHNQWADEQLGLG